MTAQSDSGFYLLNTSKNYLMSPKIVDKKQKSKEISRAALKLFSLKGYAATSVGQIAKAASIGKGTVYEYFDTKKDIFIAAIMEWMSIILGHLSEHIKEIKDPVARLRAMAEINTELVNSVNPTDLRLSMEFLRHSMVEDGVLYQHRYLIKDMLAGLRKMVVDTLLDGVSKGIFHPEIARDAEKIAINLLAYIDGISLHSILSKNYFDLKEQINLYTQNLINEISVDS
ncbi:MAG: TetR/AcrR family transcriptional regulator [Deltaproteobacteria bacterium]|nr:TetR/AcrR family transcriptional regulator [Deltaproteobacteria bacterium]